MSAQPYTPVINFLILLQPLNRLQNDATDVGALFISTWLSLDLNIDFASLMQKRKGAST
jgi:hypothetical protein